MRARGGGSDCGQVACLGCVDQAKMHNCPPKVILPPADNVPGVAGIGPKTAAALLQEWGTLEGVLAHAEEAKPKKAAAQLMSGASRGGGGPFAC